MLMEVDNINFKRYKLNSFAKIQKKLLVCCWIIAFLSCAVEVGMYVALILINQPVAHQTSYILLRIVLPNVLKVIALGLGQWAYRNNSISVEKKSLFVSLSIFIIASSLAVIHNYFSILLVSPAFTFFITSVFGDRKIIRILGILVVPVFILEITTFMLDPECGPYFYRILTLICSACIIFVSYIYSITLVGTSANQLDYIHKSYETQTNLIEELKIEPLTKLYNRSALANAMERISLMTETNGVRSYIAIIDLDFFKSVNDTYGHVCGDEVLVTLSEIIRKNIGSIRNAFRYGGEEFVLIFADSELSHVVQTVESIRLDFGNTAFEFAPGKSFTLSAGIAEYCKNGNPSGWIDCADRALYSAKKNGRNQYRVFEGQ